MTPETRQGGPHQRLDLTAYDDDCRTRSRNSQLDPGAGLVPTTQDDHPCRNRRDFLSKLADFRLVTDEAGA